MGLWRRLQELRPLVAAHPGLLHILLGSLFATATTAVTIAILPFYFLAKGFSFLELGGVYSVVALATLVAPLVAGRWPQVFSRRGVVLTLVMTSALALPAYLFAQTPLHMMIVTAGRAWSGAAASPGLQVLVAEAAPPERRAEVFGQLGALTSIVYACGVATGAALLAVGFDAAFAVGSALSLAGAGLLARVVLARPGRRGGGAAALARAARARLEGEHARVRAARLALQAGAPVPRATLRGQRAIALHLFAFSLSLAIYPIYFPMHLAQAGLPMPWTGTVVAAGWVTYGLVQPYAGRWADATGRHLTFALVGVSAAVALNVAMAFAPLAGVVVAWALLGIADGVCRPMISALMLRIVPPGSRARSFGSMDFAAGLAAAAAPFALAFVIRDVGIRGGLLVVAFVLALSILPLALARPAAAPAARPAPEATVS